MIVVDASALIAVLLRLPAAPSIEARLSRTGETWHAPHLIDVEVAHVLRRLVMQGKIDDVRGGVALADLAGMPLRRYSHALLLSTAWRLRANVTAYDAMYVGLADVLDTPLLTHDGKLAAAVGSLIAVVHF